MSVGCQTRRLRPSRQATNGGYLNDGWRNKGRDMSYDYDFFRVIADVQTPDDLVESNMQPIGTLAEIRKALTSAFPDANLTDLGGWLDERRAMGDVLFGDPTGISFTVSRIDVEDVKRICQVLDIVAFDGQEMLFIRA